MLAPASLCFVLALEMLMRKRSEFMQTFSFCFLSSPKFPTFIPPLLHSRHTEGPRWCLMSSWGHVSLWRGVFCIHLNELHPPNNLYQMNTIWPTRKVCHLELSSEYGFAGHGVMDYPGEGSECNRGCLAAAETMQMHLVLYHFMHKVSLWY